MSLFKTFQIAASGVTLDLNGFDLVGVAGSLDGVSVTLLNAINVSVRNGSVRSWGGSGINLTDANVNNVPLLRTDAEPHQVEAALVTRSVRVRLNHARLLQMAALA